MKNLLLLPFRFAGSVVKVTALLAALILVVALLMPHFGGEEVCADCQNWQSRCETLESELAQMDQALNSEHLLLRQIELRFLPELGLEWLGFRTGPFWEDVGIRHFERCPAGTREVVWCSSLVECTMITLDQSCSQ